MRELGIVHVEIEIQVPASRVFEFISNVETHPLYATYVDKVFITSTLKKGENVTFHQILKAVQDSSTGGEVDSVITTWLKDKEIKWQNQTEPLVDVSYVLELTGRGTRVIHRVESSLFDDVEKWKTSYIENVHELANLKMLLENK